MQRAAAEKNALGETAPLRSILQALADLIELLQRRIMDADIAAIVHVID